MLKIFLNWCFQASLIASVIIGASGLFLAKPPGEIAFNAGLALITAFIFKGLERFE